MKFLLRVGAACRALIEKPSFARFIAFGLGELLQTHSQATESLVLVPGRSGSLVLSSWAVSTVVMFPIIVDGSIRISITTFFAVCICAFLIWMLSLYCKSD